MIQNRIIPYGYCKKMGKIQIDPVECEVIKQIYIDYAAGCSYKKIAEMLTEKQIKYIETKSEWNKNMVARILQSEKYLGNAEYPAIISSEMKIKSNCAQKVYTHTLSSELKSIKPLLRCEKCGGKLKRKMKSNSRERWYCENDPNHISSKLYDKKIVDLAKDVINKDFINIKFIEKDSNQTSIEIIRLQNSIDLAMKEQEIDVKGLQENILKLAELKYMMLENTTHLLETALENIIDNPTENISELKKIVTSIYINDREIKKVIFADGQMI
ncbi:MAG: recombinase family protein [Clostridia bacterium]